MNTGLNGRLLNCMFGGGPPGYRTSHSRQADIRTIEPVEYEVLPVTGRLTRYSLHRLLVNRELLDENDDPVRSAKEKWADSDGLLHALQSSRSAVDCADLLVAESTAVVIGWEEGRAQGGYPVRCRLCRDAAVTIAVLSRTIGGIYLACREADYSFEKLLGTQLVVDEELAPDSKTTGGDSGRRSGGQLQTGVTAASADGSRIVRKGGSL